MLCIKEASSCPPHPDPRPIEWGEGEAIGCVCFFELIVRETVADGVESGDARMPPFLLSEKSLLFG